MSILGKLLIVFNLLAAAAFAWFTLENWKLRQDLTFRALENEVRLRGLPVDPGDPPSSLDKDHVPFNFEPRAGGTVLQDLSKKDAAKLLSPGDATYGDAGAEPIYSQQGELIRVQKKVIGTLPPQGDNNRNSYLKTYLLNLAPGGAERDGVNALFDMLDPNKVNEARRDLPYLARTSSQVAALKTAVEVAGLNDIPVGTAENVRTTRIAAVRDIVRQFVVGEVPHGAAGEEEGRKLKNAIERRAPKNEILGLTTAPGFEQLADALAELLTDKPSQDKAIKALVLYAESKAIVPPEKNAVTGIGTLINSPAGAANIPATVDTVAENLLNSKFDEAAVAAGGKTGNAVGEKARKIAHILYHIDAHRHAAKDQATVDARKAWHTRVAGVVGMQEYVRATEAQASEFTEASQRLLSVITEEESAFQAEYQALVQRVQFAYTQWLTLDAAYKAQDAITKDNERLKAERETERDNLRVALTNAIAAAKTALQKLQDDQGQLFRIQKQLRDAQAALMSLEIELRRLELADKN